MPPVVFRKGSTRVVSSVVEFSGSGVTLASSGGVAVVTISGGGGGTSDHAALSHLAWTASAHTGTASRIAYFGSGGAAAELSVGTGLVVSGSALAVDTGTIATLAAVASALTGYVPTTRTVSTSAPLSGGGALSSDLSLTLSGWSGTTNGQILYRSGGSVATATVSSPLTWAGGALGIQVASGSQAGALSASDWTVFNSKEPAISAGTTSQYWRGDKSWQTLDKSAVGLGLVENTALSTWAGTTNVVTVGTIATGTWHGSTIGVGYGGTGLTSYTSGALVYASGTTTLAGLAIGASGSFLTVSSGLPAWVSGSGLLASVGALETFQLEAGAGTAGAVTFDGVTAVSGYTLVGSTYTANATTFAPAYSTVTFTASVIVIMKGLVFQAQNVVLSGGVSPEISFPGAAASGTTPGAGASPLTGAPLGGGATGGAGRTTGGVGNAGGSLTQGVGMVPSSGTGGASVGVAGGACGSVTTSFAANPGKYSPIEVAAHLKFMNTTDSSTGAVSPKSMWGGAGGGGGTLGLLTGAPRSGAGGGGGGVVSVGIGSISGSGTLKITVPGGAGSAGNLNGGTGNCGGGQGGPAGFIMAWIRSIGAGTTVSCEAIGGNGGNGTIGGAGAGAAGGDGGPGGRIFVAYANGTAPSTNVSGGTKGTDAGAPLTPAANGPAGTAIVYQVQ